MAATICIWNIFVMITYLEGNINIYGLLKGQGIEWKFVYRPSRGRGPYKNFSPYK